MCGRFSFFDVEKIQDRFGTVNSLEITPSFTISPGANTAVITRHSPNKVELMKWGLIPYWAPPSSRLTRDFGGTSVPQSGTRKVIKRIINARAEGIESKPSFRKLIRSQRCLVPVNGFYEWKKEGDDKGNKGNKGKSIPYLFWLKVEPIFALAGIYDIWYDLERRPIYSFAIITTAANKVMAPIHDRMPVILERKDEEKWLGEGLRGLELLKPYQGKGLVAKELNHWAN